MKRIKEIQLLAIILILGGNVIAQLPQFTPVDTGGIYDLGQSRMHISAIVEDIDNDGDLDPIISNNGMPLPYFPPLTLYKNDRQGRYEQRVLFEEISNAFEIFVISPFGDIDNDGDIDIIGQRYSNPWLGVFSNDGYGNYTSVTGIYLPFDLENSTYPVLFDYNKDGFLDLVQFDTCVTMLPNDGGGQFLEPVYFSYSEEIPNDIFFHGVSWGDVDNDGDMDYYLGTTSFNYYTKNVFFLNTDSGLQKMDENHITLSDTAFTPCVNWIDYDNDGDLDLFVDNVTLDTVNGAHRSLYENLGNLEFEKHIFDDKNFRGSHSNSSVWGDIDNDGDLDLFISIENNPFPLGGQLSTHPYNILYLNNGDGQFTNIFDHTLTTTDSHTAKLFDHDNDGDLDVLMVRYSWAVDGHNQLYINNGNDNSSISITCTDKYSCATPFGTRIYAKTSINGKHVSQTREITPVNGHLSYSNTRIHFGLGDAEIVDSLIIRWPSGHIDTILDVPANQFYHAIEDSILEIDFKARNYIQLSSDFTDVGFSETGESVNIDLNDHYKLIIGDTIPDIIGDTLEFVYTNENSNVVNAALDGGVLTLNAGLQGGASTIQVIASAGFTQRMDQFTVSSSVSTTSIRTKRLINIYPNPVKDIFHIELKDKGEYLIDISSINGQFILSEKLQGTSHHIDLSYYQKGIYFITIRAKDFVTTEKIIKL